MKGMIEKVCAPIRSLVFLLAVLFVGAGHSLHAAELNISPMPLFLNQTVAPNVFFELDDSGSMDWDILTTRHWAACDYDNLIYGNSNPGSGNRNLNSKICYSSMREDGYWWAYAPTWYGGTDDVSYAYIFDSGNNNDAYSNNGCGGGVTSIALENCGFNSNTARSDWRIFASGLNVMYYNPNVDYKPWKGDCENNTPCADADFTKARANPTQGAVGYSTERDLTGIIYSIWHDDKGFDLDDGRPYRGTQFQARDGYPDSPGFNATDVPNGLIDLWDSHETFVVGANSITWTKTSYNPSRAQHQLGLNPQVEPIDTLTGNACFDKLGKRDEDGNPTSCRTIVEAKQNIANWFQYYRRRMYVVKAAISEIVDAKPGYRYAASMINLWSSAPSGHSHLFHEVPPLGANHGAYNKKLLDDLFAFRTPQKGTPLREGLIRTGRYFDSDGNNLGKRDPIEFECQKNFGILFTDGHYYNDYLGIGDIDKDGVSDRLSDVAQYYYNKDLSGMDNLVPADAFDDATHQHMVTFTAALGLFGVLEDTNGDGWPNINQDNNLTLNEKGQVITVDTGTIVNPSSIGGWGDARGGDGPIPEKIDDMWHAAYNGRGLFTAAGNPQELVEDLVEAISNIQSRMSSSAAVALNSGTLDANSRIYQARFDSTDWSGKLESIPISDGNSCGNKPKGALCNVEWEADRELRRKSPGNRNINTFDSGQAAGQEKIPFLWASMSSQMRNTLKIDPDTLIPGPPTTDNLGAKRVNYLRGARGQEADRNGTFRVRSGNKLGDIINSSPIFVGVPAFNYHNDFEAEKYSVYREDHRDRTGLVYVGSNDGIFHAFNGNTGEEVFGYVPSKLVPKMNKLTSQNYRHEFYVNGQSASGDAFVAGEWGTYVTSTLGAGEQGLFVLNVTKPDNLGPDSLMWEVRDDDPVNDFKDVGNIMGRAHVVKLNNDDWAVVFGNGYNSTKADGVVGSGDAVLYIVKLSDGSLIVPPISTGFGSTPGDDPSGSGYPNGLSEVTPVDINGDKKVDYIYGGDLFGNVWKFDLRGTSESDWKPAFGPRKPLFTATDNDNGSKKPQPITSAVTVATHPANRNHTLVFFGTGKYFEIDDNVVANEQTQTFYAITDKNESTYFDKNRVRDAYVEQKITDEVAQSGTVFRKVTHPDDGSEYRVDWSVHDGWLMDLTNQKLNPLDNMGERVITKPFVRGNRIIFITLIPSTNACRDGGDGWLMELDYRHGGRLPLSPFDVNNDGVIDSQDLYQSKAYGGSKIEGIPTTPGVLNDPSSGADGGLGGELKIISTSRSGDNIDVVKESATPGYTRTSWRMLK